MFKINFLKFVFKMLDTIFEDYDLQKERLKGRQLFVMKRYSPGMLHTAPKSWARGRRRLPNELKFGSHFKAPSLCRSLSLNFNFQACVIYL